jgi:hypothetical protein
MTTVVQVRKGGKRTRGETLENRRERIEGEARQGQSKEETWDAARALFAKPPDRDTDRPHRAKSDAF